MAKVHQLVDPQTAATENTVHHTDWEQCFLCQEETLEPLHCPGHSKRGTVGAGYKTISDILVGFNDIGCLPKTIQLSRLDDGDGIEVTLQNHMAKWHDSCRLKFNKTQLQRAQKRKSTEGQKEEISNKYTRSSTKQDAFCNNLCFFCDKGPKEEPLHEASTFDLDIKVRKCALKLQDKPLLAKLSAGDLIAQEAKYHVKCLTSLYNKARDAKFCEETESDAINHGIAFAGLVSYIEECLMSDQVAPVFKMVDLANLYTNRLDQLGTSVTNRVHTTRLKERILAYFPDMTAYKQGRDIVISSNMDIGSALRKACKYDADDDAMHLARAANIVRREMFKMKSTFTDSFQEGCQMRSVPNSLLALVHMILHGSNIKDQTSNSTFPQSTLSLAQLLMFNSIMRHRGTSTHTSNIRHNQQRETPLPIYLGVMVHTRTRKRELVDTLFSLGLSVSYDRVIGISTDLGNKLCKYYEMEKTVCPPQLQGHLFTTAAVDNIDYNPSSTTSHDSFHGTGISLFQHQSDETRGVARAESFRHLEASDTKLANLPESYTRVPPVILSKQDPSVPRLEGPNKADCCLFPHALEKEYRWLDQMQRFLAVDTLEDDATVSWAAFHASTQQPNTVKDSRTLITTLLPLFHDQAKSVAMIKHSMDIVKKAVMTLNPGQIPVLVADQPLFTIAKQIQWKYPEFYGESKFVVMLGGFHIEMGAFKVIGNLLEDSGWTSALVQASISTSGTADSFIRVSHVTRTRRAHQITASALYQLMVKAFALYNNSEGNKVMSLDNWCTERARASPQFQFWFIILQLELTVMVYLRSLREANFPLYIDALSKIVPWFFALDHTHYARWVPVHLRDMVTMQSCLPSVYNEFLKGNFTVKKTSHAFSSMAIDQAHEQNNAIVKGDGGAVGLTENPSALRRWMVAGPEMARLVGEFEVQLDKTKATDLKHHEQRRHVQKAFAQDVQSLISVFEDMGNPFSDTSSDLLVLDSRDLTDPGVINTVREIEKLGEQQYTLYVKERLVEQTVPLLDPIKRNNLPLFSRPPAREKSKGQLQVSSLKNDCSLFSRLYIASQIRHGNLDEFFKYENQAYPPAISQLGQIRSGSKSSLVNCLEDLVSNENASSNPVTEVVVLDGAAIVNMLRPGASKTFSDYSTTVFLPYIKSHLQNAQRVDIVWDEYFDHSLKSGTRKKRGKGVRRRVEPSNSIPSNWQEFLRIDENKVELFSYLARSMTEIDTEKQLITTHHEQVMCTQPHDTSNLSPCSHEEADTRIMLHVQDAVQSGFQRALIRSVDTDVVILAVNLTQWLEMEELWVAFGTGKNFHYLPIHEIARALGPQKCLALPMFHSLTGCDTVSFFAGRGKKTAWDIWNTFDEVTPAFCALGRTPLMVGEDVMKAIERFVILLYDRTSSVECINEARKQLFTQKGRTLENLPPTKAALEQHIKRAAFQAGHCWFQMRVLAPALPSPDDWGWKRNEKGDFKIYWTSLPEVADVCKELLRCSCKKGCRGHCKCCKASLPCTALCLCGGDCSHSHSIC